MTAEQQFNLFANLVEFIYKDTKDTDNGSLGERLMQVVREYDLYLWEMEKVNRAREYADTAKDRSIADLPQDLFPLVSVTPNGLAVLEEFYATERGLVIHYLSASGAEGGAVRTDAVSATAVGMGTCVFPPEGEGWTDIKFNFLIAQRYADKTYDITPGQSVPDSQTAAHHICREQIMDALIQMAYVTKPRQTLVVASTKSTQKRQKKGYPPGVAPRAQDREVHIVLDPDELRIVKRKATEAKGGSHASPVPHRRRAHKRTFKAERYKKAKGQTREFGEVYVKCKPGEKMCLPRKVYHVKRVST